MGSVTSAMAGTASRYLRAATDAEVQAARQAFTDATKGAAKSVPKVPSFLEKTFYIDMPSNPILQHIVKAYQTMRIFIKAKQQNMPEFAIISRYGDKTAQYVEKLAGKKRFINWGNNLFSNKAQDVFGVQMDKDHFVTVVSMPK